MAIKYCSRFLFWFPIYFQSRYARYACRVHLIHFFVCAFHTSTLIFFYFWHVDFGLQTVSRHVVDYTRSATGNRGGTILFAFRRSKHDTNIDDQNDFRRRTSAQSIGNTKTSHEYAQHACLLRPRRTEIRGKSSENVVRINRASVQILRVRFRDHFSTRPDVAVVVWKLNSNDRFLNDVRVAPASHNPYRSEVTRQRFSRETTTMLWLFLFFYPLLVWRCRHLKIT